MSDSTQAQKVNDDDQAASISSHDEPLTTG
jgi:hypothetical protein